GVILLDPFAQDARLLEQALLFQGPLEDHLQLLHVDGLAQVVLRPQLHGPHGGLHRPVRGHEDHHRLRPHPPDLVQELQAVHPGHAQVGEDDVGIDLLEQGEAGAGVVGLGHVVPVLAQQRLQRRRRVDLVVDDHDPALGLHARTPSFSSVAAGRGSAIVNTAPFPSPLVAAISPPCCRTICCTMDRPRPVPLGLVVTKSWNTSTPSGSPGPVSRTTSRAWPSTTPLSTDTSPPSGMASQALRSRLITTCFIFSVSIWSGGTGPPTALRLTFTPCSRASGSRSCTTSSTSTV